MQQVKVLPLAPKPLCTPQQYDDSYRVPVQLDQPLWPLESCEQYINADILAFCTQLDVLIISQPMETLQSQRKVVTFEHGFTGKVVTILDKMNEKLRRCRINSSVQEYLISSGIGKLYPRVSKYLQQPESYSSSESSKELEAYHIQVNLLNNLLVIAQQIQSDVLTCASHKYIAHQLAILYQCVGTFGEPLFEYKKSIETKFNEIKTACSTDSSGSPSTCRLPSHLSQWLWTLTHNLIQASISFHPDFTSQFKPLLYTARKECF